MRPPSRDRRQPAAACAERREQAFHRPALLAYVATACALSLAVWIPFAPVRLAAALALAAVFPGYALLRFTRIALAPLERFALGVLTALCASTVAMHVSGSLLHRADPAFMRLVLGALALGSAILAGAGVPEQDERQPRRPSAATLATLAVCLAFSLAITFLSHYITPDNWPGTLKDNSKYLFIIPELQARIPPNNVFFLPEGAQPLGYYYFLHLAMAVLANAGGVSVSTAFLAGCLVVTTLSALIPFIVVQSLFSERAARWATWLRTFVGGFDWIPYCLLLTIANALEKRPWTWMQLTFCDEQWNAWFGSRVIVPLTHHWWFPQHEVALGGLAFLLAIFVRAKQGCNEFGYHAHQASMAVAIALTAQWIAAKTEAKSWRPWHVALVALALLISLAETHWSIRRVRGHILHMPPERVHPVARMAQEVRTKLPANAVVQGVPSFDGIYRPQAYYLPRAVIADTFDAATFAADPARFSQTHNLILNGFATPDPALGHAVFSHLGVTHVIVGRHESDFLREHAKSDEGLQKFANRVFFIPVYVSKDVSLYALKPLANPPKLQFKTSP